MHGRQHIELWKRFHWLHLFGLVVLTLLFLLAMHLSHQLTASNLTIPILSLSANAVLDLAVIALCFILQKYFSGAWRAIFILIGIENIIRTVVATQLIVLFWQSNSPSAPFQSLTTNILHTIFFILRPVYWVFLAILAIRNSRAKIKMLIPSLPCALTILVAVGYMLWLFHYYQASQHLSVWAIMNATYDVLLFAFLIYCLPIAKNTAIILFILSYIIHVMGDIMGTNIYFFLPYFSNLTPSQFMWTFSDLLQAYSLLMLINNENHNTKKWFYPIDSARAQIGYWGNSIASTLFLLLGIRNVVFAEDFKNAQLLLHTHVIVFIPFVSLLSLLTLSFTRLFTKDFNTIGRVMSNFDNPKKRKQLEKKPLYFKELRRLNRYLIEQLGIFRQKTAKEKQLISMTKHIANNIQKPLSLITDLSRKFEDDLDADQQSIYKIGLTHIKGIANELLALDPQSNINPFEQNQSSLTANYIGITFHELMLEKNTQYNKDDINFKTKIDTRAWFVVAKIARSDFYRIISNLINNAVEATEGQKERVITCHMRYTPNAKTFQVAIKDSGKGMSQTQIDKILAGQSKTTREKGYGIGLHYVMETLKKWHGHCQISSQEKQGTEFIITLPVLLPIPSWWTDHVEAPKEGTIIIYDGDVFYHHLWETLFASHKKDLPNITLIHCYTKSDLEQSIKPSGKQLIIIDTDTEEDPMQGLTMISKYKLHHCAIFFTHISHDEKVQAHCTAENIKLLPKPLAQHITIKVSD